MYDFMLREDMVLVVSPFVYLKVVDSQVDDLVGDHGLRGELQLEARKVLLYEESDNYDEALYELLGSALRETGGAENELEKRLNRDIADLITSDRFAGIRIWDEEEDEDAD